MSDSLWRLGLLRSRLPCPPLSPRVCSDSCPLSQWCCLTVSSSAIPLLLPSVFPSIRVFSPESTLHISWSKYWSFSINPSSEYSGLISFRIDWFDLLAIQGTLKSLFQRLSFQCSALCYSSHIHTWLLENRSFDYMDLCWQSDVSAF